ncbi:GTP 3',8-cyclase MoaA [Undibacterium cyanobacteriorum]|uniref:GTP 3',8-cyclase n=1 Tax=Undibacterium cyanobacteriorum TaxID=3073561 RepID=A0ABY9RDB2_9BURK|nr:GTP 3',8-cyclase MoaA [Undibacterium sp. 20NA77.5]WMW79202.1 GTP 3',8-cyclase MoaA [Undibacterium sp. 20NA77.5]
MRLRHWDTPVRTIAAEGELRDQRGRHLHDLRISITDRCNFRCTYCMPKEVFTKDYPYLPHSELLSFEEIERLARIFVAHGVRKIRLTGGEPLLRKNVERLVAMLAQLRTPDGQAIDLTLTTNGSLLPQKARALKEAGLNRLTVSLDALDDLIFKRMNDVDYPVSAVLDGISAAEAAGFASIKINMVVKRGVNDSEILPMARYFQKTSQVLRFIEFMDVGASNAWQHQHVVSSQEIIDRLQHAGLELAPVAPQQKGETAVRYRYQNGGEVGFISSVSQAFCGDCNRLRLSTQGALYTCLFATQGHDLRSHLRASEFTDQATADAALSTIIRQIWEARQDRYSELRGQTSPDHFSEHRHTALAQKIEMSYIGG